MGGARRSRSAQAVAVERAVLTDLGALDDRFAERMLDTEMARVLWSVRHLLPAPIRRRSVTLAGLAARVRWHDGRIIEAMDAGIDQVVVLGAGYDSRAWRLARQGVRFFELDHPVTQEDKRRRAPSLGPTYVPADLRSDDAGEALVAGGLDPSRAALLVVEGVTMYLAEDVVRRQFRSLADASGPESRLSVDFYPPQDEGSSMNRRQNAIQHLARRGSGEGLHLTVSREEAIALVESVGWSVGEAVGAREAAQSLLPPSSRLRIDAVNDAKSLISARKAVHRRIESDIS